MKELVFLLEEQSAKEMLQAMLPSILSDHIIIKYITFSGKRDLKKRMENKISGYGSSPEINTFFLIICDRDLSNCSELKKELMEKIPRDKKSQSLVRIACGELESFYLGDLSAVEKGLSLKAGSISQRQLSEKYRDPDQLSKAFEELAKLTGDDYQKVKGSREIGKYLNCDENRSKSFINLCRGIKKLVDA